VTDPEGPSSRRRPLQYSLRSLFGLMVAVAAVFGTLRWLNVSATASAVVLVILIVAVAAAVALLAAIAAADDED
jgi:predicted RND superfamily exporter protein